MASYTRFYRGIAFDVPGSYSAPDDTGGMVQPPGGSIFPIVMGVSLGGQPNTPYAFTSPQEAVETLLGGELLTAIQRAFQTQPSSFGQPASPFTVYGIRVGNATQASLSLADAAPNAASQQTITYTGTATAGTGTLSYGGQTTTAIAYNATASTINTAFNALSSVIAAGGATVTGSFTAGPIVVTFTTNGARTPVSTNYSGLVGITAANVVQTVVGSANLANAISLLSNGYGSYANGIRVTVTNSTAPLGPYVVQVQKDADASMDAFNKTTDPVGRQSLDIQYTGTGTAVSLTVNGTSLTTSVTGAPADNLNIPFATYTTLQSVVDHINATGKYIAAVDDDNANRASTSMDWINSVTITSPMTIQYTGTGTAATGAVGTDDLGSVFTTTVTGAPGDQVSLELNDSVYPTLADLAAGITGIATANATVGGGGDLTYTGSVYTVVLKAPFIQMPLESLPLQTLTNFKTAAVPLQGAYTITENLQALVDFFNDYFGILFTATRNPLSGGARIASVGPAYFSGGTNGVAHGTAWANAFQAAQSVDSQIIVPVTSDPDIHTMGLVHCMTMSGPSERKERVLFVGGASGEIETEALSRAQFLRAQGDGSFAQLVWPGITDIDFQGNVLTIPPYILAAQMAGLSCGLGVGKSKTNKFIRATGVETELTRSQIGALIRGGVTVIEHKTVGAQRGFRVAKDISIYGGQTNYLRHLMASKITTLIVSKTVREALEPMIGLPNDKDFVTNARNNVITTLSKCRDRGWLVDGDTTPAYGNIVITRDTDTVSIDFEATVVTEVDFIFTTLHLTVYRKGQ